MATHSDDLRGPDGGPEGRRVRPTILAFMRHYLPGYRAGGPIRTISGMVRRLGSDFDFRIVTQDRDAGDDGGYAGIPTAQWVRRDGAHAMYLNPSRVTLGSLVRLLRETPHDVVYLNSLFDSLFTLRILTARRMGLVPDHPVVLAPRGELSEGALGIRGGRKWIYRKIARLGGLLRGVVWHASNEMEAEEIRVAFWGQDVGRIAVASNLSVLEPLSQPVEPSRGAGGPLRVCFLSRISPKKNLDFALKVLATVREPVHFTIYGPPSDPGYWEACRKLMDRLPPHVTAEAPGPVDAKDAITVLAGHDLFFFPTLGENYGHVIREALSAGLPVLTSDRTPWSDLEEEGVGWTIPLGEPDRFSEVIEAFATRSTGEWRDTRGRCRAYIAQSVSDPATLRANRQMFLSVLGSQTEGDEYVEGTGA